MSVEVGALAPDFDVETTEGLCSLKQLLAHGRLVLLFYSEDATPTCTTQVCSFRDEYSTLSELGATVLAVSADSLESHRRFAERVGGLPFPLASDHELAMARAYDVVDEDGNRSRRAAFVIASDGVVVEAVQRYSPGAVDHFAAVFRALGVEL